MAKAKLANLPLAPTPSQIDPSAKVAFTVPEFCIRNGLSRAKYRKLKAAKRGPREMRYGFNTIRITLDAERDWQRAMEQDAEEFDAKATARAVKAAAASVDSPRHISKLARQQGDKS
jgi:hypothetical protein